MKKNASDKFTPSVAQSAIASAYKKKEVIRKFQFESKSSPGTFYETLVYRDSSMSCNCRGWIYSAAKNNGIRSCVHTKEVAGQLEETEVKIKLTNTPTSGKKKEVEPVKTPVVVILAKATRRFSFEE